jgi:hypothetical protein
MDIDTAEGLASLARMLGKMNERTILNGLTLDLVVVLAAAMRRQGSLSDNDITYIDDAFVNAGNGWPKGQAELARKVLDDARGVWTAAA